ncbi:hypothetical protein JMA_43680 (plasmid) [Jeotgalibacillus malaysiensis]|uniref:Uncharacterized protein n=1 Tax=Jeotgalibacillus malaysiensis TaxID=1508404 RepID=A0A0B5ATZ7_9BACL|nr:hypothetical protein [Jeotgalibacillus malaysiensis]AJD93685.1 hypothetical protein JMA_43680 [Jeotgalibacillus malaysiensis]
MKLELEEFDKYWELHVKCGNDWGRDSEIEVRKYSTQEEVEDAIKHKDYYETILSIKEVVEHKVQFVKSN